MMPMETFLETLRNTPCYEIVAHYYTGKVARRSGVPYINHIAEGAFLLHHIYQSDADTIAAFCVHPLFQTNKGLQLLLSGYTGDLERITARSIVLAMEYRRVVNAYTISQPVREPVHIELSFLPEVNEMIAADKIQNRKDFRKHLYKPLARASYNRTLERGERYFDSWLEKLGVSDAMYAESATLLSEA